MAARFERSGVGQPEIEINVFDEHGRRLLNYDADLNNELQNLISDREEREIIAHHGVEKPDWFLAMEDDARMFFANIGFDNLSSIYLLKEHADLDKIGLHGRSALAQTETYNRYVLARHKVIENIAQSEGVVKTASILVHELAHLTHAHSYVTAQLGRPEEAGGCVGVKSGFVYVDDIKGRGIFLEEAFASYFAGLYVRSKNNEWLATSITSTPAPYVPEHYRFRDDGIDRFGGDTTMGPDGYTMEMLIWAVERKGVMRGEEFVVDLLASRRKDSQAYAMRNIISAINAVQPGLYEKLSRIEYEKAGWEDGCALVYEAVTGNLWPEN